MKKVAVLLTIAFLTMGNSSCAINPLPGEEEPAIFICTIIDNEVAECVHTYDQNTKKDLTLIDMIGYQCVRPKDFGTLKSHHEILHKAIHNLQSGGN